MPVAGRQSSSRRPRPARHGPGPHKSSVSTSTHDTCMRHNCSADRPVPDGQQARSARVGTPRSQRPEATRCEQPPRLQAPDTVCARLQLVDDDRRLARPRCVPDNHTAITRAGDHVLPLARGRRRAQRRARPARALRELRRRERLRAARAVRHPARGACGRSHAPLGMAASPRPGLACPAGVSRPAPPPAGVAGAAVDARRHERALMRSE